MSQFGFTPLISRPTRITDHSATLIDHIFTNSCHAVTKSGVLADSDLSDHLATFATLLTDRKKLNCKIGTEAARDSYIRLINRSTKETFVKNINQVDWNFLLEIGNADNKFEAFNNKYLEIYNASFPMKKGKPGRRAESKPWLLEWLSCACARKNALYQKFVKEPSSENKTKYTRMKKFCEKHIRIAKRKFYNSYFERYSTDSKKQWQMIDQLLNRNKKAKTKIGKITYNGNTISGNSNIAEAFNDYFTNIAQKLKDKLGHPSTSHSPEPSGYKFTPTMFPDKVTQEEIHKIIKNLKEKATSDTSIGPLKAVSYTLSPVLQHLIDASMEQGIFPTQLKVAKVIPLFKSGSRTQITNYRPISLLSSFSKIYEKVMHARLTAHLATKKIIFPSQYGFRSGHSCEHTLLEAQNSIINALERKKVAALLLLDFSKAFDMVEHDKLLSKLEGYGVRGPYLSWFKSYLTGRSQYVHVNNQDSQLKPLNHGVPQGSILGPTLFLIYINNLPSCTPLAQFFIFADDSNLLITADSAEELKMRCNIALRAVNDWVSSNGLKLNADKTKLIVFTNKQKKEARSIRVTLNDYVINVTDKGKFLGVIMDQNLSWIPHIKALASKVSRNAGIMYKLRYTLPLKALKCLYSSFIQSHLLYCTSVWGTVKKARLSSLFAAQKKGVRAFGSRDTVYFYDKETGETPSHTKPIFNKLNLLALPNLIAKSILGMVHKSRLKVAPPSIGDLFSDHIVTTPPRITRSVSSAAPKYFAEPTYSLENSKLQISYVGPRLYNKIVSEHNSNQDPKIGHSDLSTKFYNPFKKSVTNLLLGLQSLPNPDHTSNSDSWDSINFPLESLIK